jgi:hypothetical protein
MVRASDRGRLRSMSNSPLPLIRLDMDGHGHWDVVSSDPQTHVVCASLDDARRVAFGRAARRPCELVVCDAYHRVVLHQVIEDPAA